MTRLLVRSSSLTLWRKFRWPGSFVVRAWDFQRWREIRSQITPIPIEADEVGKFDGQLAGPIMPHPHSTAWLDDVLATGRGWSRQQALDWFRGFYLQQLERLDPQRVLDGMMVALEGSGADGPVLLCSCKDAAICHRTMLLDWLGQVADVEEIVPALRVVKAKGARKGTGASTGLLDLGQEDEPCR